MELTYEERNLVEVATNIFKFKPEKIITFTGEMGAGKTTLIKEICKVLGVTSATSSPTFSLVNTYQSPDGPIYHFDCYRLKTETEALDMGIEEYLDSGHWCLIEWPEKITNLLPEKHTALHIDVDNEGCRILRNTNEYITNFSFL